jgi:hypothetical protein
MTDYTMYSYNVTLQVHEAIFSGSGGTCPVVA